MAVIVLIRDAETPGLYHEEGADVTWVMDAYTEPRESLFDCEACGQEIEDWDLMTCMDGGEAAHTGCCEIREA